MWTYNQTQQSDELMHYGVLGMKWGVRREQRLAVKTKKLQNKRHDIQSRNGVANRKFMNNSKKLYYVKSKYNLQKAKNNNDSVNKTVSKFDIKNYKNIKKHGLDPMDGYSFNKVYGANVKGKDREALKLKEGQSITKRTKAKKAGVMALFLSPVAISAGVKFFNNNTDKIASVMVKKISISTKSINLLISIII